jgi:hypothetical protein
LNKLIVLVVLLFPLSLSAQRNQLVLIKKDEVVIRYRLGDDISYKRKDKAETLRGFIVEVNDSIIITSNDTVATHQIEKLFFRKGNFMNIVGGFLVTAGSAFFIIDQLNTIVINDQEPSLSTNVSNITLTSLAIGLPMLLITKKSHRVGFKERLRIVDSESPFYYSESRFRNKGYVSPHIPRN